MRRAVRNTRLRDVSAIRLRDTRTTGPHRRSEAYDGGGRSNGRGKGPAMRLRSIAALVLVAVVATGIVAWILHAGPVDHWLAVHTGTVNEPGPYYGFWSGFGSDLAEFSILGAIGTS